MTLCDPKFAAVLSGYNDRLAREAKIIHDPEALKTIDVNDFLIPVGEEVGRLMHSLVVGLDARIIVELGTSYGDALAYQRAVRAIPGDAGDAAPCRQRHRYRGQAGLRRSELIMGLIRR